MRTRYSEDQQAIASAFSAFFAKESPPSAVRAAAARGTGFDRELWRKLCSTGAPGMAAPGEHGGGDAALADLGVVVWEWGRRIAPVPLVEHAVATRLIIAACCESGRSPADGSPRGTGAGPAARGARAVRPEAPVNELIADLTAGERIATMALRPLDDRRRARLVPAGAVADAVAALDGAALIVSAGNPPGEARPNTADLPLADRDLSEGVAIAQFGHCPAEGAAGRGQADSPGGEGGTAWGRALAEWKALMAVAYCGLTRQALDMGVAYVKQRHQFGVPVGSFQAVQHGLAEAATRAEGARLLAWRAVGALDRGRPEGRRLASMALLFAAESARFATDRALQYHGGYGYSEEYDIQLYYRRAAGWLLQLGEPAAEIARLADAELGPKARSL